MTRNFARPKPLPDGDMQAPVFALAEVCEEYMQALADGDNVDRCAKISAHIEEAALDAVYGKGAWSTWVNARMMDK